MEFNAQNCDSADIRGEEAKNIANTRVYYFDELNEGNWTSTGYIMIK